MISRYTIALGVVVGLFASAEAGAQIFVNRTTIPQTYPIDPDLIINAVNYGGGYQPGYGDPVTLTVPAAVLDVDPDVTDWEAGGADGSFPAALGSTDPVAPGPAVPEPSTLVMAIAALTATMVTRSLRRQRRGP